jgi:hypothetical protein
VDEADGVDEEVSVYAIDALGVEGVAGIAIELFTDVLATVEMVGIDEVISEAVIMVEVEVTAVDVEVDVVVVVNTFPVVVFTTIWVVVVIGVVGAVVDSAVDAVGEVGWHVAWRSSQIPP